MDEASFLAQMETDRGPAEVVAARQVIDWSRNRLPNFTFRAAAKTSTFWPCLDHAGRTYWPVALRTNGTVEAVMRWLVPLSPFDDEAVRLEFVTRLNRIPGVTLPLTDLAGHPRFPLKTLTTEAGRLALFAALEWFIATTTGVETST